MIHLMSWVGAPGYRHLGRRGHVVVPGVCPLSVAQLPRAGAGGETRAAHPVTVPERGGQITGRQRDLVCAETLQNEILFEFP